jgi:hypothetical protein
VSSVYRSRQFRALAAGLCSVAAFLVGYYGVLLVIESFRGYGSAFGDAALFVAGLFLIGLAVVIFVLVIAKPFSPRSDEQDRGTKSSDNLS